MPVRSWAIGVAICVSGAGAPRAQTAADLFQDYSAGRFDAVVSSFEKRFQSQDDVDRFVREVRRTSAAWRTEPIAAFALEAAAVHWRRIYLYPAAFGATRARARELFELGCSRARESTDAEFAVRWHVAAIALLTGPPDERWGGSSVSERAHLVLEEHYGHVDKRLSGQPRLAMAWAVNRDLLVQRAVYAHRIADQPVPPTMRDVHGWMRDASGGFERVVSEPALAPEATLRLGLIRFYEGRSEDALALWQKIPSLSAAASYRFLALMLRGRVLAASDPDEAEVAFRAALLLHPDAQSAQMPLAALLFAAGRLNESVRLAQATLAQATPGRDPWWTYIDARWPSHLSSLRELVR